jgi:hypothetical protein
MENSTIHLGLTVAHSYRGSLVQAQHARPTARPLAGPCHWPLPNMHMACGLHTRPQLERAPWRAHRRQKLRVFLG